MEYATLKSQKQMDYEKRRRCNSRARRATRTTRQQPSLFDKVMYYFVTFIHIFLVFFAIVTATVVLIVVCASVAHYEQRCCNETVISIVPAVDGKFHVTIEKAQTVNIISKQLSRNDSLSGESWLNLTMQMENRMMLVHLKLSPTTDSPKMRSNITDGMLDGSKTNLSTSVERRRPTVPTTP